MSIGLAGCVNALFDDANAILELLIFAGSVTLCEQLSGFEPPIDDITFGADVFRQSDVVGTAGFMKRSLVRRPCVAQWKKGKYT